MYISKLHLQGFKSFLNKTDLDFINAKARRYNISRSALMKIAALNVELTVEQLDQPLRMPKT